MASRKTCSVIWLIDEATGSVCVRVCGVCPACLHCQVCSAFVYPHAGDEISTVLQINMVSPWVMYAYINIYSLCVCLLDTLKDVG